MRSTARLPARPASALHSLCMGMLAAVLLTGSMLAAAAPVVTASIRPLQLIAAAITDGVSEPQLVLGAGQDPHHVSLRPSERRALAEADVLLWTGPMLELPLAELMEDLDGKVLAVQSMDGITLHAVDGSPDPHVWLDTHNARQIAATLTEVLVQLDSDNGQQYQANQSKFAEALDELDSVITQQLAQSRQQPWAVYHNAFRYFERQFALAAPLALSEDSNNQAGIRSIAALRTAMAEQKVNCMLTEPVTNSAELQTTLGADLNIVTADVMGLGLASSPDAYVQLMQNLAAAFSECLRGQP